MKYKSLLFDLDGTLTDSYEGIIKSIKYALNKMDIDFNDDAVLMKFVGPPLIDSYQKYIGMSEEDAVKALHLYREYFAETGIFENRLYDGIKEMLAELYEQGCDILLATSKPEPYALRILEHFDILKYFSYVAGCPMDEKGVTKIDVMKRALNNAKTTNKTEIVMIGDTEFDINGAKICGVDSVAVLYGIGEYDEICHATHIAETVEDLKKQLLGQ